LLLLNRPCDYFPGLYSIVLHPAAFVVNRETQDSAGTRPVCTIANAKC